MSAGILKNVVRRGFYLDSVALMRLSSEIAASPETLDAVLMMATPANKKIMADAALLTESSKTAGANDLIIALRAKDEDAADSMLEVVRERLDSHARGATSSGIERARSLAGAVEAAAESNLALISVPGEFAVREARKALAHGLNVMIFSDNVPLADEIALKKEAAERDLLVMGPDCGTSILAGVPIAFANAVPRGRVGIVSASGTGLQEVSVLLARAGEGVSHGIGVGGRDLSDAVGGLTTLRAIDLLSEDPGTEHIVLISKPPGAKTAGKVFSRLASCAVPVTVCMFGLKSVTPPANAAVADTLKGVVEAVTGRSLGAFSHSLSKAGDGKRKWVHALYSGGTLCAEAQAVFSAAGIKTASNVPLAGEGSGDTKASGHLMIDLGADEYTQGRPHPMIEPAVRSASLSASLADPGVAAVLLDVILGFGAHSDPADAVVNALKDAPENRPQVIGSVCGTDRDPQNRSAQVKKLEQAGVVVAPSNADAAALAAWVVSE